MNFINGRPEGWEDRKIQRMLGVRFADAISWKSERKTTYDDIYEVGANSMKDWFIQWLESKTSMTKGKDRYIIITGEEWEELVK